MGNRALRRWKTFTKYVSRIKKRMWWGIKDENTPQGHRYPKNWKEMDKDDAHEVKMLKKTSTRWSSKWEDSDNHIRIKKMRQDNKDIIDKELKD
jgi:hypothetical protein